jgi:hypothetical protein
MNWKEYDELCKLQQEKNEKYLDVFEDDLLKEKLTQKV